MESPLVPQQRSLQSVDQALAVLEYLAACQGPLALTRLAQELGTSKARMHRMLSTLKQRGFVSQDETFRYSFGPACTRLAERSRLSLSAIELCLPTMRALWESTTETILLTVFQDDRAVVVEKLDSPRPVLARSLLGTSLPLHAVSTGKILLASRPDAEIERLLSQGLTRYTPTTCIDPERLRRELQKIRTAGYAVNRGGYRDGVSGVAAPVRWSRTGPVAAALAVCAPAARFANDFVSLRDQVIVAAAAASDALGANSERLRHTGAAA